jgi:alkyldihydroxyacetonephosphate synthase
METEKVVHIYEDVENEAREEILRSGGSISHHHGIGKIRKRFVKTTLPPVAFELMDGIKKTLDPKNIFAINNTIYRSEEEEKADLQGQH